MLSAIKYTGFFIGLLLLCPLLLFAQNNVQSFTVEQAKAYGVDHHYESLNANLDEDWAKQRALEIITTGLPVLKSGISYQNSFVLPTTLIPNEFFGNPTDGFQEVVFGTKHNSKAFFEINQLIVDGRYIVGLKTNETLKELYSQLSARTQRDVKFEIEQSYFAALVANETERLFSENLPILEKTLYETSELFKNGFVEELDVDRLQLSINNFKSQLESSKYQKVLAINVLKFRMGYPIEDSLILTGSLDEFLEDGESNADFGYDHKQRLEYKILHNQMMMREHDRKQTVMGYMPSLNFFFNYEFSAQRDEFNFFDFNESWYKSGMFGFQLDIPIFDSFNKKFQAQQRRIDRDKNVNQLESFDLTVAVEVERAKTEYLNASNQLDYQKENLELAHKIFSKSTIKYQEGVGSSLELTDAQSSLTTTQINYTNALYKYLVSKSALRKARGFYQ